jgi:hypothetical protein
MESQSYAQPAQLFWNSGSAKGPGFISVPAAKCGQDLFKPIVGRGSAFADIDGDGDLDVVLAQVGGPPLLLRNDQKLGRQWIKFKLVGATSNRDAIGAQIRVQCGKQTLWRTVMPTRGYLSQSEAPVVIGLDENKRIDSVDIVWPGGKTQPVPSFRIGALNVVKEDR